MRARTAIAAGAALSLLAACANKPPANSGARGLPVTGSEALHKVQKVAVIPLVTYRQIEFSGDNPRQPAMERALERTLTSQLRERLERRNYIARFADEDIPGENKRDRDFEIEQLRAALAAAVNRVPKTTQEAEVEELDVTGVLGATVGPAAAVVATRMDVDAILFVRYDGFRKSGGQRAGDMVGNVMLGVLTGLATGVSIMRSSATEGGVLNMALIYGATGEVLWAGRGRHAVYAGPARPPRNMQSTATGAMNAAIASLRGSSVPPPAAASRPPRQIEEPLAEPQQPAVATPRNEDPKTQPAANEEVAFWTSVRDSNNPAELQAYIDKYPQGVFVPLAKVRLEALSRPQAQPATYSPPPAPSHPTKQRNRPD